MLAIVNSVAVFGMDAFDVKVEVDVSNGLPSFEIVGLPDASVRESKDRVRTAIKNSGFEFPIKKITVNLAPADIRKEGPAFDLPIAVGILAATGQIPIEKIHKTAFIGELSLDGTLRSINGVLAMAAHIKKLNYFFLLPINNAPEAALAGNDFVVGLNDLKELTVLLTENEFPTVSVNVEEMFRHCNEFEIDFSEVKGQRVVKRALEIAAAGMHNILLIGSPGSGKTMLARRMETILPPLSFEESLLLTKIYSIAGKLPSKENLVLKRPFRSPHHSSSVQSVVGGGRFPKPGEISLATYGILFLDEFPEFHRDVLESMRQPIEDGIVNITRMAGHCSFPAKPLLIAAMNPCPCGYLGDTSKECNCTPHQIRRYLSKISGPILDRIDMHVHVQRLQLHEIQNENENENSKVIRERVTLAREIQKARFSGTGIITNSEMGRKEIKKFIILSADAKKLINDVFSKLHLSARAYDRILKVARTIADLAASEVIEEEHVSEAIQYRNLDKIYYEI